MRLNTLLILIMILVAIPISYALTASIGNARMVLRTEVEQGTPTIIDKSILTKNVNDIPVKVSLEADDNYKKIIEIFEDTYTLQPGGSKNANFRITLKSGGNYDGKIFVTFAAEDPTSKTPPVGLSSSIAILAEGDITDEYYEVMKPVEDVEEAEPVEEVEDVEEVPVEEGEGGSVSVSFGSKLPQEFKEKSDTNPLIIIIVLVFIILISIVVVYYITR